MTIQYIDFLKNQHFNSLAHILRVPFRSAEWRTDHADIPFHVLSNHFIDVTPTQEIAWDRGAVLVAFTKLITAVVAADPRLAYSEADIAWFVSLMDQPPGVYRPVVKMFQAWYSAPDETVSAQEAADATGTAASGWRNKAAAGEYPGAYKIGKTWLIPERYIKSGSD